MLTQFAKSVYYRRLFNRTAAPSDLTQCAAYIHAGDTVLDLGANLGIFSKTLSRMVGPSGQVHAVELMPQTFSYLHGNVASLGNVFRYNVGISDRTGTRYAQQPERLPGGGGHIYRAHIAETGIQVRTYRLDDLFPDLSPTFIKCDVEDHELAVIRGAQQIIKRCQPIWLMETDDPEAFRAMEALGYEKHPIGNDWLFVCHPSG
jgi:FkbM family methyltransferase